MKKYSATILASISAAILLTGCGSENGVMFTVEEYQKTHDFKPIYDLLPEGMKGWSF